MTPTVLGVIEKYTNIARNGAHAPRGLSKHEHNDNTKERNSVTTIILFYSNLLINSISTLTSPTEMGGHNAWSTASPFLV